MHNADKRAINSCMLQYNFPITKLLISLFIESSISQPPSECARYNLMTSFARQQRSFDVYSP